MLQLALIFFVLAVFAALFGFGLVASSFASAAKIMFWILVALFLMSLVSGLVRRPA